jgi:hypothetical protein
MKDPVIKLITNAGTSYYLRKLTVDTCGWWIFKFRILRGEDAEIGFPLIYGFPLDCIKEITVCGDAV